MPWLCSMVPMAPSASRTSEESRSSKLLMSAPLRLFDHGEVCIVALDDVDNGRLWVGGQVKVVAREGHHVVVVWRPLGLVGGIGLQVGPHVELQQVSGALDPDGRVGGC